MAGCCGGYLALQEDRMLLRFLTGNVVKTRESSGVTGSTWADARCANECKNTLSWTRTRLSLADHARSCSKFLQITGPATAATIAEHRPEKRPDGD
jgi:hypothetical protein